MKRLLFIFLVAGFIFSAGCEKPPVEEPVLEQPAPPPIDTTGANPIGG